MAVRQKQNKGLFPNTKSLFADILYNTGDIYDFTFV